MKAQTVSRFFAICLGSLFISQTVFGAQPEPKLPPLNVTKQKLLFNPKTCNIGDTGGVHTGCEGAVVKIIGRKNGKCRFTYNTDACGGVHSYYIGEVPVDSGPVTIEVFNGGIQRSFPTKTLKLIRSTGPLTTVLVKGTKGYVSFAFNERRSEMIPKNGDKVKFRFLFFKGREFKEHLPNARTDGVTEFTVGSDKSEPWLETAMEYMSVGDRRRIWLPSKIATGLGDWLPGENLPETLFVEIRLISLQQAK